MEITRNPIIFGEEVDMKLIAEILTLVTLFLLASLIFIDTSSAQAVTIAEEHPSDVISGLIWALGIAGSVIVTMATFIWIRWIRNDQEFKEGLMRELTGIRSEQKEGNQKFEVMNNTMHRIEAQLKEEINLLGSRVSVIENTCAIFHNKKNP